MKNVLAAFIMLTSSLAMATTEEIYSGENCTVVREKRSNGSVFYIETPTAREVVGVADNLSFGTFAYCSDKALKIHSFEGKSGQAIMLSCDEHQNDRAVTRGRVDLEFIEGKLQSITVDGQVKKMFRWIQETSIRCANLVKK